MAMFENFPYTDLHNLNLDWIIKIAKDFLDQYTHIQQLIADGETSLQNLTESGLQQLGDETESGLQQLQDKADNLESLLNAWYDTHSEDIAQQLADALADLNAWYTTHEGYLDSYVTASITAFNNAAETKAQETLQSIPSDYTELADKNEQYAGFWHTTTGYTNNSGNNVSAANRRTTGVFYAPYGFTVKINTGYQLMAGQGATDSSFTDLGWQIVGGGTKHFDITNGSYFFFNFAKKDVSNFTANDDIGLTVIFDNSNADKIIKTETLYNGLMNMKQGYVNTSGSVIDNANRICLPPVKIDKSFTVYLNEGFQMVELVGDRPNGLTDLGWVLVNDPGRPNPKSLHISTVIGSNHSPGTYYAFIIARTAGGAISPSDDTGFRIVIDDTFDAFVLNKFKNTYYVNADGSRDFNSIIDALMITEDYSTIIVEAGTYNILAEYRNHYGSDYFTEYTGYDLSDIYSRGLYVHKKKLVFMPDTYVYAVYEDNNDYVKRYFSPFNIGIDAEIDGLNLTYANLRYAIHDDYSLLQIGTNTYKNIIIQGIPGPFTGIHWGGGFGQNVTYNFENVTFIDDQTPANYGDILYHNAEHGSGTCRFNMMNCYGERACQFKAIGETTRKSYCIVSGCTFSSIEIRSDSTANNIVLIKNNCKEN